MRIIYFTHSLASCWNHGNAHFQRGLLRELGARGHAVTAYEPAQGWSRRNLVGDHGEAQLGRFQARFSELDVRLYGNAPHLEAILHGADLVVVHEWIEPELAGAIGALRKRGGSFLLLFHDTHHRAVSEPAALRRFDLSGYDGVLAFGRSLAEVYRRAGWGSRAFVFHEAADTRLFRPRPGNSRRTDLVWVGNWGDDERSGVIASFLLRPARDLGLSVGVYGVRYPASALQTLADHGACYHGWLANAEVPEVFAHHTMTVHVPRRYYASLLPGIPTIRVFEALACGMPLLCAPWDDCEGLFAAGTDFLLARDENAMRSSMRDVANDAGLRSSLIDSGLRRIRSRHTCAHRADQLLSIVAGLASPLAGVLGSSLLSSYWNGAATYYRGIIAALARRGWRTTFYEPDAFDRQKHRDMEPPPWARVVVYPATMEAVRSVCAEAAQADVVVKASGVGVFDEEILATLLAVTSPERIRIFWDVDAPATLAALTGDPHHPLRAALHQLDLVLTYGGGPPVVAGYQAFGARRCVPIYNALDPETHFPATPDRRFEADLAFLGNRLPDREQRVERFFLAAARRLPRASFLIGGSGWEAWQLPPNVHSAGHISTRDHNAFNSSPLAVINIARDSMAATGYSPATRIFEAAGAAACIITDAWDGIELFLAPDEEILVARDGADVARHVGALTPQRAIQIGVRARRRILRQHTYEQRAETVAQLLAGLLATKRGRTVA